MYQKKLEEEREISEDPDSKDKNPKPAPPVEERVCSICKKGPEAILTMCAHCGKLGHANCTPFYEEPTYLDDDRENTFWCSRQHYEQVTETMLV